MKMKRVKIAERNVTDFHHALSDVIDALRRADDHVPIEFRESLALQIELRGGPRTDRASAYLVISYERPETPEESAEEAAKVRATLERQLAWNEGLVAEIRAKLLAHP